MPFGGLIARVAYAVLGGILAFLVFYILGAVTMSYDANIGGTVERFAPLIGLLVGIIIFFTYPKPLFQP